MPDPPNPAHGLPRLGVGPFVPRRSKFLDGTLKTFFGPGQFFDAESDEYAPPDDWPKAGTLLRVPKMVRFFYDLQDWDDAEHDDGIPPELKPGYPDWIFPDEPAQHFVNNGYYVISFDSIGTPGLDWIMIDPTTNPEFVQALLDAGWTQFSLESWNWKKGPLDAGEKAELDAIPRLAPGRNGLDITLFGDFATFELVRGFPAW